YETRQKIAVVQPKASFSAIADALLRASLLTGPERDLARSLANWLSQGKGVAADKQTIIDPQFAIAGAWYFLDVLSSRLLQPLPFAASNPRDLEAMLKCGP